MKTKNKNKLIKNPKALLLSFLIVILISVVGSQFTDTSGWYESVKPSITPPNYVFPVVWTILYIMIALALYFSWTNADKKEKKTLVSWFSVNLSANLIWSIFFFGLKLPTIAFIDILIILISSFVLVRLTWKISKTASWLLMPYALWITFATLLNFLIAF